jgi:hypothetical protein
MAVIRHPFIVAVPTPRRDRAPGGHSTGTLPLAPFLGLFGAPQGVSGAALEPYTLLALVVYAAVGWLLARVVRLLADARALDELGAGETHRPTLTP